VASRGGHGQQAWQFASAVEKMMLEGKEFWRPDQSELNLESDDRIELFYKIPRKRQFARLLTVS
jgi:hypothetical protein